MRQIPEPDWKIFRQLYTTALDRFCGQVLDDLRRMLDEPETDHHKKYLSIFKLIEQRDQVIARTFNDLRRSTAFSRLATIKSRDLLTDEELSKLSDETRAVIDFLLR
jgi:hypothetical protein